MAFALPAIEVVDSRIQDWNISIYDTIADNASAGLFVLGGSPKKLDQIDLRLCGMRLDHQGEPLSVGCGAACLGNPLSGAGRSVIARFYCIGWGSDSCVFPCSWSIC